MQPDDLARLLAELKAKGPQAQRAVITIEQATAYAVAMTGQPPQFVRGEVNRIFSTELASDAMRRETHRHARNDRAGHPALKRKR